MNESQFDSVQLLQQWRNGDERCAAILFDRYVERLVALARTKLSSRMQRRVAAEDVVQSAYRSFFVKAGDGRYTLESSGDLWRLMAAITISKVRGQVEFNSAKKRAVYDEASMNDRSGFGISPEQTAREPDPAEAIGVVEELEAVMSGLSPLHRQILELRLQHDSVEEIAVEVERSERTIRRVLKNIRGDLHQRLEHTRAR